MSADEKPTSSESEPKSTPAGPAAPRDDGAVPPPADRRPAPDPVNELTPEEQMERFERELKETDWGHQPC